jgi:hypothetical protein
MPTGTVKDDMVPLVDAALAASLSYNQLWRLCLRRDVQAERRGRSWYCSLASLRAHLGAIADKTR